MARLLIQIPTGPENPTRAALALLIARTAVEGGHDVDVFFVGDGVSLLRPETLEATHGVGLGSLREHIDALVAGGGRLHLSRLSSVARGLSVESLGGLPATMAAPTRLVELIVAADKVVTY